MSNAWNTPDDLLHVLTEQFVQHLLDARAGTALRASPILQDEKLDFGLVKMVIRMELERAYLALLYLTYAPSHADTVLRSIRWEHFYLDDRLRLVVNRQLDVDLVDAIRFHPVEIQVGRSVVPECRQLVSSLTKALPGIANHLKYSQDRRYTVPLETCAALYAWNLRIGGSIEERALAVFPIDWLVAYFTQYALDRSSVRPCLSAWNKHVGALTSCIEQYGLPRVLEAIESVRTPVTDPFALFSSNRL